MGQAKMLTTLHSNSLTTSFFFHSNGELKVSTGIAVSFESPSHIFKSSNFSLSCSISNQTQIRKSIVIARIKKGRSGSVRSVRCLLESVYFIASKLNIIPEPLHLVLREFGGGNGGGLGFSKGFGGGGSDGRRRNRKFEFLGFVILLGLGLLLLLGKQVDIDVFLGVLVIALIGFSAIWWNINVKDWILGFCSCAFLVILRFRKEDLKNWAKGFKATDIVRRRRKKRSTGGFRHLLKMVAM